MIQITLIDPEQITSDRGCLVRVIQTILGSNKFTQFHKLYKDLTALKHHHNIQNLFKSVQLKFINKRRLESLSCVYCDLTVKIFSWRQDKLRQQFILLECFPIARHQPHNHHSFTPWPGCLEQKHCFCQNISKTVCWQKPSQIQQKTVLAETDNVMSYQVFSTEKRGGIGDKAEMIQ